MLRYSELFKKDFELLKQKYLKNIIDDIANILTKNVPELKEVNKNYEKHIVSFSFEYINIFSLQNELKYTEIELKLNKKMEFIAYINSTSYTKIDKILQFVKNYIKRFHKYRC
ncbi:hypothetical protein [Brachyspira murdochii]|uniref:Uncharacterized protein n=1 Tax=Brachyspira murdochii TaxID=84378 RepID=A0ABX5B6J2_9SPIR|nr:hypothetical protein [Brachyspira murdochii]PPS22949.1 hypothetical protein DJ52_01770 [Brachyspira murdochii]